MLWRAARSLLFQLDPERAHHLAIAALRVAGARPFAKAIRRRAEASLETQAFGVRFEHPLGLAAGFDKGEVVAPGLFALGFSHVEIGTITPRAQPGNPKPRLFRLPEHAAILNRMGFNNDGAEVCAERLERLRAGPCPGVVGVNVGKNKDTPNERAAEDYLACIDRLHAFADYLVVNISSPNTPGLRQLQERDALGRLLGACTARAAGLDRPKPLLVKLAPDLGDEALDEAVDVAVAVRAAGIIATNTTIARPGEVSTHPRSSEAGGLSGAPLEPLATRALRRVYSRAAGRMPIVGVGGVMNARDAYAKIRAGATLVQVYTGYIYGGPTFARELVKGMAGLLKRDGFARVSDAVGADLRGRTAP
jgi:dihydroorotate dehydrogenase